MHSVLVDGQDAVVESDAMELTDIRSGPDGVDEHGFDASVEKWQRVEAGGRPCEKSQTRRR